MNIFVLSFVSIFIFSIINAKKPSSDPKVPEKKNLVAPFSTAEQFSGAFLWAHKKNITGKDQVITIIEQEDVSDILK
ncbi:MAG: hypothetical protein ACK5PQ_00115 [Alphaproteobacteria bacterium]